MSAATIGVGALVAAVFAAIVGRGIYNHRRGKHTCACGSCESCGLCKKS